MSDTDNALEKNAESEEARGRLGAVPDGSDLQKVRREPARSQPADGRSRAPEARAPGRPGALRPSRSRRSGRKWHGVVLGSPFFH